MAKGMYIGVASKARKVKKMYIGVGGKARKVKKVYIGVGGKARLCWSGDSFRTKFDNSWATNKYYESTDEIPSDFVQQSLPSSMQVHFLYDPINARFYAITYSSPYLIIYYNSSIESQTWTQAGRVEGNMGQRYTSIDPENGSILYLHNSGSSGGLYLRRATVTSSGVSSETTNWVSAGDEITKIKKVGPYYCSTAVSGSTQTRIYYTSTFSGAITTGNGPGGSATYIHCKTHEIVPEPAIFYNNSQFKAYFSFYTSSYRAIRQATSSTLSFSSYSNTKQIASANADKAILGTNVDGTDALFNITTANGTGFTSTGTWTWSGKQSTSMVDNVYACYDTISDKTRVYTNGNSFYYCSGSYIWTAVTTPSDSRTGFARAIV